MNLEEAKIKAQEDLHCDDKRIILQINETDDKWIFQAGIPGVISYGGRNTISIDRTNGEIKLFILPNKENFETLKNSKIIYKYDEEW